ncbi:hypothetical protein BO85DRAFT_444601 [Aspergillus piperis CBS 112811]|uniref:WD-like domain-containing protein n=1 Tax=Aspergillus piperis CBS 112811 TaxID=1448313 RepID=A0A8G1VSV1_9EURO|nr:hypothetical protein BO85DRAFT_444601 [Aspergillus piperis CBS 112811]RAH63307.1 hypothetical protein BO85DRAFT_444601 [Aspergillus piperis CBS 112811]
MRTFSICLLAGMLLGRTTQGQQLSYSDSIQALAFGNIATSSVESRGDVWLNITGFAGIELPHIETVVGIHSLDNARELNVIANLAQSAASQALWGDVVFLYNVFSMNAYPSNANVTNAQMQAGLLDAVSGDNGPEESLIELYASTSSASSLGAAYRALTSQNNNQQQSTATISSPVAAEPTFTPTAAVDKREMDWSRNQIVCSAAHVAAGAACIALLGRVRVDGSWKTGGPRNICYKDCCISWSANATFQIENLYNDAQRCYNACLTVTGEVSCEAYNGSLQGTLVNQCLSNRPNGCA